MNNDIYEKVKNVNKVLSSGEPDNITTDKSGFKDMSGYNPQYVIDAMNKVFGIEGWRFVDLENQIADSEAVAKVEVFISDEESEYSRTAYGGKKNTKRKDGKGWNMSWADCKKSAQTDALKKALSYFSVGAKAYHGKLKK